MVQNRGSLGGLLDLEVCAVVWQSYLHGFSMRNLLYGMAKPHMNQIGTDPQTDLQTDLKYCIDPFPFVADRAIAPAPVCPSPAEKVMHQLPRRLSPLAQRVKYSLA